ncbi:MAG: hypothetical protein JWQ27_2404 [Ferruginibacter sp.]|nr:hypothetical protein [Ferruginibacter sp.]
MNALPTALIMRLVLFIGIEFILFGCKPINNITGRYVNGNTIEFSFKNQPNEFEYFLKSEMGTLQYSKGSWKRDQNNLYLFGYTRTDINTLAVESSTHKNPGDSVNKIEIHYHTENIPSSIKCLMVINDTSEYPFASDTVITPVSKLEKIQVKSYLAYTGLLSSKPGVDTLYADIPGVGKGLNKGETLVLNFTISPYDFQRIPFTDTLTLKNRNTIYAGQTKLSKSS